MATDENPIDDVAGGINDAADRVREFLTPNRPSRRKGWEQLSDGYRRRLERGGVSRSDYERGGSLHKARGHKSREREQEQRRERVVRKAPKKQQPFLREKNRYIDKMELLYGKQAGKTRRQLNKIPDKDMRRLIRRQEEAEEAYNNGDRDTATRIWNTRDRRYPDWLFYYHSYFS